jgi:hypothetical protein
MGAGFEWVTTTPRIRRIVIGVAAFCAALGVLAHGAVSAFAERTYDSQITGFNDPSSAAFDADGNAWISSAGGTNGIPGVNNPGQNGIYKYNPYPSQTLLDLPNTYQPWSFYTLELQLAVDDATGEIFVAQSNERTVSIFDKKGVYSHSWNAINGAVQDFDGIHVAIDNTNTFSRGRVYLSLTSPEDDVEVFDAAQRPVDFPATAGYIENNKLLGTPSGPFGQVQNIAVDAEGNLYVTDTDNGVVDEFDSTGTFVRTFPAPQSSPGNPGEGGVAVDPTNGNVLITGDGVDEFDSSGNQLETITQAGGGPFQPQGTPGINSQGYIYVPNQLRGSVDIFTPDAVVPKVTYKPVSSPTTTSGTLNAEVDLNGGGNVTECEFEYGEEEGNYNLGAEPCEAAFGLPYSAATDVSAEISSLAAETTYHYRVVAANANGIKYGADQTYTTSEVPGLSTDPATSLTESGARLNASFVGNGEDTTYYFEWGPTPAYGSKTAVPPGADAHSPSGPGRTSLSFDLSGLSPFSTYHYRIVATNGAGTSHGEDRIFTTTPGVPSIAEESVSQVHSDRALLHAQVNPNGADTTYHFEYVDDANYQSSGFAQATVAPTPDSGVGMSKHFQGASTLVDGLTPGTIYHYRVLAANQVGADTPGTDHTFTTFPFGSNDTCPNAHVRQQTGASLLLDCRAYELVSAANAGGYDVESNLVPGQTPFGGYPEAESPSQVLYGVHDGGIPGTGNPTEDGVDPYLATRTESGWSTEYVGIPANDPLASGPFASTLEEADPSLDTFAFGGPNICSPCFGPGQTETGEPIHLPDGELVQGMAGSIPQPAAQLAGFIGKRFSADGTHFVFGSKSKFEPDANEGEIAIYDRNLKTDETHVVSKTPSGETMQEEGTEIGELDISKDGSRIVIGHLVEEVGNAKYWHLYMDIGDSGQTIDLTPGTTHGVLYDGMSADGSRVFFTTTDALTTAADLDTDHSADIYRAEVDEAGNFSLSRVSTGAGGTGNTDLCDPAANTKHEHWNTTGSEETCGVVAVGGGGGVASGNGTIYFLSPEKLDGSSNGVQNAPNLYVARPGQAPHFIATLESSANAPVPPAVHPFLRSFGSFANPTGVAIDQASGDVYTLDVGKTEGGPGAFVRKVDSAGNSITSFGSNGKIDGSSAPQGAFLEYGIASLATEIAVDNDPASPSYGDLYVPDPINSVVDKFDSSGNYLSQISVPDLPSAVAIDQANGNVYVTGLFSGVYVYDAGGSPITSFSTISSPGPNSVAVNSNGTVYVANGGGLSGEPSSSSPLEYEPPTEHQLDANPSLGVAVDPSNDHVYVDEGNQVSEFDSSGNQIGAPIGSGFLSGSISLAADEGNLDVSNPGTGKVVAFGPSAILPDPNTDNPLVLDSASSPGTRNTADFALSASGDDAVFTSTLPLTGYDNAAQREVFRYDAPTDHLDCVSCNPTGEQATGEATLASNGLSLTDDGRVFFNSTEGLVDRDLNNKMDAYEWEPQGTEAVQGAQSCQREGGCVDLISTGSSPFDSSLLGASADGTDAYFFTRDSLVSADQNGTRVKIYDARADGGFDQAPPPHQCQASDECHGPGSQQPPAADVETTKDTPATGNVSQQSGKRKGCSRGAVKKQGHCLSKHHHKRHHHKAHRHG